MSTTQAGECREKQIGSEKCKCAVLQFLLAWCIHRVIFPLWMNTSLHKIQITQLSTDGGWGGVWEGEQTEGNGTEKTELTF